VWETVIQTANPCRGFTESSVASPGADHSPQNQFPIGHWPMIADASRKGVTGGVQPETTAPAISPGGSHENALVTLALAAQRENGLRENWNITPQHASARSPVLSALSPRSQDELQWVLASQEIQDFETDRTTGIGPAWSTHAQTSGLLAEYETRQREAGSDRPTPPIEYAPRQHGSRQRGGGGYARARDGATPAGRESNSGLCGAAGVEAGGVKETRSSRLRSAKIAEKGDRSKKADGETDRRLRGLAGVYLHVLSLSPHCPLTLARRSSRSACQLKIAFELPFLQSK